MINALMVFFIELIFLLVIELLSLLMATRIATRMTYWRGTQSLFGRLVVLVVSVAVFIGPKFYLYGWAYGIAFSLPEVHHFLFGSVVVVFASSLVLSLLNVAGILIITAIVFEYDGLGKGRLT